ncbi:inosine/guanosine kinase [Halobacteriovorax sp.]|uniref:inosine/guanosine kinase n=1 Tax=Halobacteriovorax sp. TaxID=2020862 RepID=UPI003AF2B9A5
MRFPGKRRSKHYFPVSAKGRLSFETDFNSKENVYIVGIDQLLVDIEIDAPTDLLKRYKLSPGESYILPDHIIEELYQDCLENDKILGQYAGGAVGNTLHNYSVLSDDQSFALGTICENIKVGDYAFKYICSTSSKVDFSYLQPCKGQMARAICMITPDKERTFAIGKGIMNQLDESFIPYELIKNSSALLVTAFLLRDHSAPLFKATLKAVSIAKKYKVPVVFALGTSSLIEENRDFFYNFVKENVNVLAMNRQEAHALLGIDDPLLIGQAVLDITDLALITDGDQGLYMASWACKQKARETKDKLHSKSIENYNQFEYSRGQLKEHCKEPIKIYSHINPFMGGPESIENTNGAGDAALAAILHDISANVYHRKLLPHSIKHDGTYLTYSSIHQLCKYANRTSYEVLKQKSPRLSRNLPVKEQSLEESYWDM